MIRPIIPDVSDVSHLSLITVAYPFDLFGAVVLDAVYLLSIIFPKTFELLALVAFNVVQHLIDLLGTWRDPNPSAA